MEMTRRRVGPVAFVNKVAAVVRRNQLFASPVGR